MTDLSDRGAAVDLVRSEMQSSLDRLDDLGLSLAAAYLDMALHALEVDHARSSVAMID